MPIQLPQINWPSALTEDGPEQDPSILLSGLANIGPAPHRVLAVRINPTTLAVDYRPDLEESVYDDYGLDELVDDLTILDDLDASVLVPMGNADYVVWVMPFANLDEEDE